MWIREKESDAECSGEKAQMRCDCGGCCLEKERYVDGEEKERERETTSDLVGQTHLGEREIEAT